LCEQGPLCGYFPKAAKLALVLIVKDPDLMEEANKVFAGVDIEITCEEQGNLGAATGTFDIALTSALLRCA
jgi:hypothetical protein